MTSIERLIVDEFFKNSDVVDRAENRIHVKKKMWDRVGFMVSDHDGVRRGNQIRHLWKMSNLWMKQRWMKKEKKHGRWWSSKESRKRNIKNRQPTCVRYQKKGTGEWHESKFIQAKTKFDNFCNWIRAIISTQRKRNENAMKNAFLRCSWVSLKIERQFDRGLMEESWRISNGGWRKMF